VTKTEANEISKSGVTVGQIKNMLKRAYDDRFVDERKSKVNPVMSVSVTFNIFWRAYKNKDDKEKIEGFDQLGARNALWEFGDYWEGFRPVKKINVKYSDDYHHEPAINIYEDK